MSPKHWFRSVSIWADDLCVIDLRAPSIWGERKAPKPISPLTAVAPKIMAIALIGVHIY